jgi:uncharacterized membrane protein
LYGAERVSLQRAQGVLSPTVMRTNSTPHETEPSSVEYSHLERWTSLAAGLALATAGVRRGQLPGVCLAVASAPLVYRGLTGEWPAFLSHRADTRTALGGSRGIRVDEAIRIELPVDDVYAFWRQFENFPLFMSHLEEVTRLSATRSRWVARGPAGVAVEWTAEIINEIENKLIGWQSQPGSDVAVAGSVQFLPVHGRDATILKVELQYAPPAGKAGAVLAKLFGRQPERTIREDLRRMKQLLEAGEAAQSGASRVRGGRR